MQAEPEKASASLSKYIFELHENYSKLITILNLENADISDADEHRLKLHAELEADTVKMIISLTAVIQNYLEHVTPADDSQNKLLEISEYRQEAAELSRRNIIALQSDLGKIKVKLESIKLPKSTRRVYYSGNNPTIMDIEI